MGKSGQSTTASYRASLRAHEQCGTAFVLIEYKMQYNNAHTLDYAYPYHRALRSLSTRGGEFSYFARFPTQGVRECKWDVLGMNQQPKSSLVEGRDPWYGISGQHEVVVVWTRQDKNRKL